MAALFSAGRASRPAWPWSGEISLRVKISQRITFPRWKFAGLAGRVLLRMAPDEVRQQV
ncbi:MAG TPA: hypothetical protein VL975_00190 [Candidatus Micrarchaeia archaeon]|nr:hypothetical protein [Candidatus Micrarchaeia archaeon]